MPGLAPLIAAFSAVMTLGAIALAPAPGPAQSTTGAGELKACTAADFDAERTAKPVLIAWFHAPWCPTCMRQQQVLRELIAAGVAGSPTVCQFDFDSEEALRDRLGVTGQSTLVRFRDGTETSRSRGETKPDRLRSFLEGP